MEKSLFDDDDDNTVDPLSWLSSTVNKTDTPTPSIEEKQDDDKTNENSEKATPEKSEIKNPLDDIFGTTDANDNSEPIITTTSTNTDEPQKVEKTVEEPKPSDDPLLNSDSIVEQDVVIQLQAPDEPAAESKIDPLAQNPLAQNVDPSPPGSQTIGLEDNNNNINNANVMDSESSIQHDEKVPLLYNVNTPSGPAVPRKGAMDDTRFFEDPANSSVDKPRVHAIDIMRGFAVLCTIIGNNQGNNDHRYSGVTEAPWDGLRFGDIIEPMFLFTLGLSIPLSIPTPLSARHRFSPKAWARILVRTFVLLVLALALDVMQNDFDMNAFKFTGVLQRIAVFYFVCAMSQQVIATVWKWVIPLVTMTVYLMFLCISWVPDCGQGRFTNDCNAAGYIDRTLFGDRVHQPTDKEGFFSMLSAIFIVFLGLEYGDIMTNSDFTYRGKAVFWSILGLLPVIIGSLISFGLPINHSIWSLSYVGITAGLCGIIFMILYLLLDVKLISSKLKIARYRWVLSPIRWFGMNPFALYLFFAFVEIWLQTNIKTEYDGEQQPVWIWIYWKVFAVWMRDKKFASLFVSIIWLIIGWVLAYVLYVMYWGYILTRLGTISDCFCEFDE